MEDLAIYQWTLEARKNSTDQDCVMTLACAIAQPKVFLWGEYKTWIQHNVSLPFMKNHFNSEKSSNGKSLWHLPGTVPLNFVFYTNALWSRNRARCVSSTFSYRQEDLGLKYIGAGLQYIGAQKFYFQYSGKEWREKVMIKPGFVCHMRVYQID